MKEHQQIALNDKKTVLFTDNYIFVGSEKKKYSSLLTKAFYEYADSRVYDFRYGLIMDNVVYLFYFQRMLSIEYYLTSIAIDEVEINISDWYLYNIVINAVRNVEIKYKLLRKIHNPKHLPPQIVIILSWMYLLMMQLLQPKKRNCNYNGKDLWIIRSDVARKKKYQIENTVFLEEIKIGKGSIYQSLPLFLRIKGINNALSQALKEFKTAKDIFVQNGMAEIFDSCKNFCAKRLVHIFFWGNVLEKNLIQHQFGNKIYSCNYNDSYSQIEQKITKKHKKMLVIIPHGIEDSFRFPAGLSGDLFYATSENAKDILNMKFKTNKFVYDEEIIKKLFEIRKQMSPKIGCQLFFFTDGTGNAFDIEITKHLKAYADEQGLSLHVKYHPGEKKELYAAIQGIVIEDDLATAIYQNVCIARGSTVLLESLYNGSIPIQVILKGDGVVEADTIPSLNDSRIRHARGFHELDSILDDVLFKNVKSESINTDEGFDNITMK